MNDLNVCTVRPIRDPAALEQIAAYLRTPAFSFVNGPVGGTTPAAPIDSYAVTFGMQPDVRVSERVERLFAEEAREIMTDPAYRDAAGYIYVFHDIGDPHNVLKIGRTERDPRQRIREWERELAPQEGKSVQLLAAYGTVANEFAEAVVQEILRCHHIANRINPLTNRELIEFYSIENLLALKLFVRETLRFVDRYCTHWRARRRRGN